MNWNDHLFDGPDGWIAPGRSLGHAQRYQLRDGLIYCESVVAMRAPVDMIVDRLLGRWNWWRKGTARAFQRFEDGSSVQVLAPVWWYWARIRVRSSVPVAWGEGGVRIPVRLSGTWVGPASWDVFPDPARPGWSIVRSRFHGVENHVPFFGDDIATRAHLGAEAGNLFPPFPKGTGLVGLAAELKMAA
jgi:hypothetical protein